MSPQRSHRSEKAAQQRRQARLPEHLEHDEGSLADHADLEGVRITGDLVAPPDVRTIIGAELKASRWSSGRLTGHRFRRLRCIDVVFDNCDLSGAILEDSALTRVEFHECRMSGVVLAGARMNDVLFSRCKLDTANLRMLDGTRVEFRDSDLREADFHEAHLTATALHDSDLSGADFSRVSPDRLRLHGSQVHDLRGASALDGAMIDPDQRMDMAMALFNASGIIVDEKR